MPYPKIIIYILALLLLTPYFALAHAGHEGFIDFDELLNEISETDISDNNASITNSISATADSGNNTAASGEVVEGKAEAEIKQKTIINGQVLKDKAINKSATGNVEVKAESRIEADGQGASVKTTTEINGQSEVSEKTVDLDKPKTGELNPENTASGPDMDIQNTAVCGPEAVNSSCPDQDLGSTPAGRPDKTGQSGLKYFLAALWRDIKENLSGLFSVFT